MMKQSMNSAMLQNIVTCQSLADQLFAENFGFGNYFAHPRLIIQLPLLKVPV